MAKLNIHEAKMHLPKYLLKVQEGETIILCEKGVPVAQITPLPKKMKPEKQLFGLAKGMGKIPDSFFDFLTEKDFPVAGL